MPPQDRADASDDVPVIDPPRGLNESPVVDDPRVLLEPRSEVAGADTRSGLTAGSDPPATDARAITRDSIATTADGHANAGAPSDASGAAEPAGSPALDGADGTTPTVDEAWMDVALHEADRAASLGEVPVGCVLVGPDGAILSTAHNQRETLQDPTAHAEMIAIRAAAEKLGSWRLEGVTCFVTLEPCAMCAGALVHARVARVVYGCDDPKGGAVATLFAIGADPRLNHRFALVRGVRSFECASRLRAFFAALRALGKK